MFNHLRLYREQRSWSTKRLALRSYVSERTIQGIEYGEHEPRQGTKRKLCKALGISWESRGLVWPEESTE